MTLAEESLMKKVNTSSHQSIIGVLENDKCCRICEASSVTALLTSLISPTLGICSCFGILKTLVAVEKLLTVLTHVSEFRFKRKRQEVSCSLLVPTPTLVNAFARSGRSSVIHVRKASVNVVLVLFVVFM